MLRRLALASLTLASGCQSGDVLHGPALALENANGTSVDLSTMVTARIAYDLDTLGVNERVLSSPISGGTYAIDVSYLGESTQFYERIELDDASGLALVGGTPWLTQADGSSVRVVMGAPGTCAIVPSLALATGRDAVGVALVGRYVLVAGGSEAGGPSAKVDRLDLVSLSRTAMPDAAAPLGPSRAARIDRTSALVLSDLGEPFIQTLASLDATTGRSLPALHPGGETSQQIANVGPSGAAVVGTSPSGTPTNELSFVLPDSHYVFVNAIETSATQRMAAAGATGLYVASYDTPTHFRFEHIPSEAGDVRFRVGYDDGAGASRERRFGTLMSDRDGVTFGVIGGTDQNGAVRDDTMTIGGCPALCYTAAGPTWTHARSGATFTSDGFIAGGDGPDGRVERVRLRPSDTAPMVIEDFATLNVPRSRPGVVALPSGPILVIGGQGASGRVTETEICFPPN